MRYGRFLGQSGGTGWRDETVFDVEFVEYEIRDNYCQLQIQVGRFVDRYDAITIDWGDGTVDRQTTYFAWHNYTRVGRYTIRIGRECRWFRVWDCFTVTREGMSLVSRPQMWLRQWSDWLDSAEGSFCGWGDPDHGGLKGSLPPWGRSITTTYCCFEYCTDIVGKFPEWTDAITDACGTFQHVKIRDRIPKWGKNITRAGFCYYKCPNVYGPVPAWPGNCVEMNSCYCGCAGLEGMIPAWPAVAQELDGVYEDCSGLTGIIPAWPEGLTMCGSCYKNCVGLTGAWTHDPAQLMPEEKVRYSPTSDYYRCYDVVKGCSDALRALFWDKNWGGTIPRPTPAPKGP